MADRAEGVSEDNVANTDEAQTAAAAADAQPGDTETPLVLEDDRLSERARENREKRYADKGKAKVVEISSSESDDSKECVTAAAAGDDDDEEEKNTDKKALEELDFQYAMMLQEEEYRMGAAVLPPPPGFDPNVVVGSEDISSDENAGLLLTDEDDVNTDDELAMMDQAAIVPDDSLPMPISAYHPALVMDAAAWRRRLPASSICVSKTLIEDEVIPIIGRLDLIVEEAAALGSCPEIINQTHHSPISKNLILYDTNDFRYNMRLSSFHNFDADGSPLEIEYCIDTNWPRFVGRNRLEAGDVINIYKTTDPRIHPGPYFVIKISRGLGKIPWSVLSTGLAKEDEPLPSSSKTSKPDNDDDGDVQMLGTATDSQPSCISSSTDKSGDTDSKDVKSTSKVEERSPGKRKKTDCDTGEDESGNTLESGNEDQKKEGKGLVIKFPKKQ